MPQPDPESEDPDARDPRVFTTHTGAPMDFGNWTKHWWKPAVAAVFGEDHPLHDLRYGRLRAAAITSWLVDGETLEWCARQAGNTPGVIEQHYRGVLDEIGYEERQRERARRRLPSGAASSTLVEADLATLTARDLAEIQARLAQEGVRRSRAAHC